MKFNMMMWLMVVVVVFTAGIEFGYDLQKRTPLDMRWHLVGCLDA